MNLRWIAALFLVGVAYFVFGHEALAGMMSSPENVIVNFGRSVGNAVTGTATAITQLIWS